MTDFIILSLIVWRISSLAVNEAAPFDIMARFRDWIGVKYNENNQRVAVNFFGKLFSCVFCMSMYVAWGVAAIYLKTWDFLWYGLALSGAAIVINRWVNR